jgi:hypothetical protein
VESTTRLNTCTIDNAKHEELCHKSKYSTIRTSIDKQRIMGKRAHRRSCFWWLFQCRHGRRSVGAGTERVRTVGRARMRKCLMVLGLDLTLVDTDSRGSVGSYESGMTRIEQVDLTLFVLRVTRLDKTPPRYKTQLKK